MFSELNGSQQISRQSRYFWSPGIVTIAALIVKHVVTAAVTPV
jgi:hypothetical protein